MERFVRVVLLWVLTLQGGFTSPTITDLLITAGEDIYLTCDGDGDLDWHYPAMNDTTERSRLKMLWTGSHSRLTIKIEEAIYRDTGYYRCLQKNGETEAKIYVFVKDPAKPFILGSRIAEAIDGEMVIISCHPTSPEFTIKLFKDMQQVEVTWDGRNGTWRFDPKRGFILDHVYRKHEGTYHCQSNGYRKYVILKVLGMLSSGDDLGPKITSTNKKELVINAGEDIELTCESNSPLNWTTPSLEENANVDISEEVRGHGRYRYASYLNLRRAQGYHTGYYKCFEVENETNEDKVYIYVKNESYPFVNQYSLIFVVVNQYQTAVFDCRPNSPDIPVTLETAGGEKLSIGENAEDGTVLNYDPKIGFTLQNVGAIHDGLYHCIAGNNDLMILLKIMLVRGHLSKPAITSNKESHLIVGDNVTLTCSVSVDYGITFAMEWEIPSTSRAFQKNRILLGSSIAVPDPNELENMGRRNITIYKITKQDEGRYFCKVEDQYGNRINNSKHIVVYEKNESYIKFKFTLQHTIINETVGKPVQWVVPLGSHPNATLTWYTPDNTPIKLGKSDKYEVLIKDFSTWTKLEIYDIKFHDRGIYKLQVDNGFETKIANFTLIVRGKPIVELQMNQSYVFGENATISCDVEGFPLPDITWYFKGCNNLLSCPYDGDVSKLPESQYINIPDGDAKIRSILKFRADISGHLTCSASNSEGRVNETSDFLVSGLLSSRPKITSTNKKELVINAGEDIELTCESNSPLNWTIPNLEENANVDISQEVGGHGRYRYASYLNLRQAQGYHTGYYKCFEVENETNEDKVYIYVKNESYPFVKHRSLYFLTVRQNQTAVFDCRPNSPDIQVTLETAGGNELSIGENPEYGSVLDYDPKIGFTLQYINARQDRIYFCKAGSHELIFLLMIIGKSHQ